MYARDSDNWPSRNPPGPWTAHNGLAEHASRPFGGSDKIPGHPRLPAPLPARAWLERAGGVVSIAASLPLGTATQGEGQEEQIGALGLVVNCIVRYNTIYTQRALEQLAADGYEIRRDDVRRLSPLGYEHVTLTGRYHVILADPIRRGEYRPLKTPDLADLASA
jgi:hypothetical protein